MAQESVSVPAQGPTAPATTAAPASTAALLAGYLHAVGVRHVFGYPGESVIDFMEATRHQGIDTVRFYHAEGDKLEGVGPLYTGTYGKP